MAFDKFGVAGDVARMLMELIDLGPTPRTVEDNPLTFDERKQVIHDVLKMVEDRIVWFVDNKVTPPVEPGVLPSLEEFGRIGGGRNSVDNNPVKVVFDDGSTFSFSGSGGFEGATPPRVAAPLAFRL